MADRASSMVVLLAAFLLVALHTAHAAGPLPKPIRAAVVFALGGGNDLGWEFQWTEAVESLKQSRPNDVTFTMWPEISSSSAFSQLVDDIQATTDLFILSSVTFQMDVLAAAEKYPSKYFILPGFLAGNNHMSLYIRIEESRFLSGIVAGWMTKTKKIGYVNAFPFLETQLAFWSFQLGVKEIVPDAEFILYQLDTFSDTYRDNAATVELIDKHGCDVIASHVNSNGPQNTARKKGKFSVGYASDRSRQLGGSVLTSDTHVWTPFFSQVIDHLIAGTFPANLNPFSLGLNDGATAQAPFSGDVNATVQASVTSYLNTAKSSIFCGPRVGKATQSDCYTSATYSSVLPSGSFEIGSKTTVVKFFVPLQSSKISLSNNIAGKKVNITFDSSNFAEWKSGGSMNFTLPAGFTPSPTWSTTGRVLSESFTGTFTWSVAQVSTNPSVWRLVFKRNTDGVEYAGPLKFEMEDVFHNPGSSGGTGVYQCSFYGPDGNKIAESLDIGESSIVNAAIGDLSVAFSSLKMGKSGSIVIKGTTENGWPSSGSIDIVLPSQFGISSATTGTIDVTAKKSLERAFRASEQTTVTTDTSTNTINVKRSGSGSSITGSFSVTVCCVGNPPTAGSTGSKISVVLKDETGRTMTAAVTEDNVVVEDDPAPLIETLGPAVGGAVGGLLIIGVLFYFLWRRRQLQKELANLDWVIDFEDLVFDSTKGEKSAMSLLSKQSAGTNVTRSTFSRKLGKAFCLRADYGGRVVAVKIVQNKEQVSLSFEVRMEMKMMRDTHHTNLVEFIGAVVGPPQVALVTEYCDKGSLVDIVGHMELDWDFKYSILTDVATGLQQIHKSKLQSHGRLKMSNIFVDSRWVAKVGDYGCHCFKEESMPFLDEENEITYSNLQWTSPELLSDAYAFYGPQFTLEHIEFGSADGDIWSFGCILFEVASGDSPYALCLDLTPLEVIEGIKNGEVEPETDILKNCEEGVGISESFVEFVEDCLSRDPSERPNATKCINQLKKMNPRKGNLIDNMNKMLEKYSKNLEGIVAERTKELEVEKQKSESLLAEMLPRKVMEDLKLGKEIEPESFDCVSIFFSDIVGFTNIAGGSTPLQVVALLNHLYTTFDAQISEHDVYKVETIGDAYMIASGLPERNGDRHAAEMANCALDLLSCTDTFQIPHMPDRQLQLRVGIHSGPVVAGVVGLKMPRYCLFGDTVNTASRMESGGMALRIHLSQSTCTLLEQTGGYHLDCRGEIEVKGKGAMRTYWLTGKDGFSKTLPDLSKAATKSQHEFK